VGELMQEVTVNAEAQMVNTTTAETSGLVGEREVKDLPLNGRSFDDLITLNAGTVNFTPMHTTSSAYTGGLGNRFSVSGRRTDSNIFLLNGVEYGGNGSIATSPGSVSRQLLGIDAIREFNVLRDNYSAEYGKRAGRSVSSPCPARINFTAARSSFCATAYWMRGTFSTIQPAYGFLLSSATISAVPPAVPSGRIRRLCLGITKDCGNDSD
jgi:TonB-dependent receptor-like protein